MEHVFDFSRFVTERFQYNDTLNPEFWTSDKFDEGVRKKLMSIAEDFYNDLKVKVPMIDVRLTGSMANYTWSKHSDLDVHVVIDFSEIDDNEGLVRKALDGQRFVWNLRHPVVIMGHDVELYMQDDDEKHTSSGVYSLMHSKWVVEPKYDPPDVDADYVERKADSFEREISAIGETLKGNDPDDPKRVLDRVEVLKQKIMKARQVGLDRDGEYSIENLVFKQLRQSGWIEKLMELGARAYSAIYSDEPMGVKKEMGELTEHVLPFHKFVMEDFAYDEETKRKIAEELADLHSLSELNLIPQNVLDAKRKEIMKKSGDPEAVWKDPVLGPLIASDIYQSLKTPEFKALQDLGYVVRSTYRQIMNGSIAVAPPTAKLAMTIRSDGGVFRPGSGSRKLEYEAPGSGYSMYANAYAWIKDNVCHTDSKLRKNSTVQKEGEVIDANMKMLRPSYEAILRLGFTEEETRHLMGYTLTWDKKNQKIEHYNLSVSSLLKHGILPIVGYRYNELTRELEEKITQMKMKWTFYPQSNYVTVGPTRAEKKSADLTYSALQLYVSVPPELLDVLKDDDDYPDRQTQVRFENLDYFTQVFIKPFSGIDKLSVIIETCKIVGDLDCVGLDMFSGCKIGGNLRSYARKYSAYNDNTRFGFYDIKSWDGKMYITADQGSIFDVSIKPMYLERILINNKPILEIIDAAGMSRTPDYDETTIAVGMTEAQLNSGVHFNSTWRDFTVAMWNGDRIKKLFIPKQQRS